MDTPSHAAPPGRTCTLKLRGGETGGSIMMFEETLPAGTTSLHHLHRDSDEVAWVLAGEFTFKVGDTVSVGGPGTCAFMPRNVPHAWKNTGTEAGRVLFLYTPASAGASLRSLRRAAIWMPTSARRCSSVTSGRWSAPTRFECAANGLNRLTRLRAARTGRSRRGAGCLPAPRLMPADAAPDCCRCRCADAGAGGGRASLAGPGVSSRNTTRRSWR